MQQRALRSSTMSDVPPIGTTLGRLRILETYINYDGPKLFACENAAGQIFLASFVEDQPDAELYLYVPTSRERWIAVRRGAMSVRSAFESPEDGYALLVRRPLADGELEARTITAAEVNPLWLPDSDAIVRLP